VSDAEAAVEATISAAAPSRAAPVHAVDAAEPLSSCLPRRAALAPSAAAGAAVAAKALLPPQILAGSDLPRPVWWMAIGPRTGRAASWGVEAAVAKFSSGTPPAVRRYAGHALAVSRDLA